MSKLTELASKATPRPWSAPPYIVPWSKDAPDMAYVAGVVMPRANAALIIALVNNLDAIQALWDAAEKCRHAGSDGYRTMLIADDDYDALMSAVKSLRDLLGGDHE